jgi:hypothetical protein
MVGWLPLLLVGCGSNGTVPAPGDPAHFDAMASLPAVEAFAGAGARLVSLHETGLRADGTVDLTLERARSNVQYAFVRDVPAPANAPPVGAGGSLDGKYHEDVDVDLGQARLYTVNQNGSTYQYRFRGMQREATTGAGAASTATPPPHCDLATLWKGLGAPPTAEAMVSYDASGWDLWVSGTELRTGYDADCHPR